MRAHVAPPSLSRGLFLCVWGFAKRATLLHLLPPEEHTDPPHCKGRGVWRPTSRTHHATPPTSRDGAQHSTGSGRTQKDMQGTHNLCKGAATSHARRGCRSVESVPRQEQQEEEEEPGGIGKGWAGGVETWEGEGVSPLTRRRLRSTFATLSTCLSQSRTIGCPQSRRSQSINASRAVEFTVLRDWVSSRPAISTVSGVKNAFGDLHCGQVHESPSRSKGVLGGAVMPAPVACEAKAGGRGRGGGGVAVAESGTGGTVDRRRVHGGWSSPRCVWSVSVPMPHISGGRPIRDLRMLCRLRRAADAHRGCEVASGRRRVPLAGAEGARVHARGAPFCICTRRQCTRRRHSPCA